MNLRLRIASVALLVAMLLVAVKLAQAQGKALAEADLIKLIELQLEEKTVLSRIAKAGIGFTADDAAVERLKQAGASEAVIEAVKKAATAKPKAAAKGKPITYADVLKLVELGIEEKDILKRLEDSPTLFTLGGEQVEELKKAGASDTLIAVLQGKKATKKVGEVTDLAIVLDCSGSMSYDTSDKQQKMKVAKDVTADLVKRIPNGMNLTFVIYGHKSYGKTDERNCQAVEVVRPLGRLDDAGKEELVQFIANLKPVGHTPISLSLEVAGKELAKNKGAACGLILITDGVETCHRDPAAEAAKLAGSLNLSFGVNVIGFDINDEERKAVQQIAERGNGKYRNAKNAKELALAVEEVIEPVAPDPAPKPAPGRRAVKVLSPKIKLPPMKRVVLVKGKASYFTVNSYKVAEIDKYDQEIRVPSDQKHEIWWQGDEGIAVRMLADFSLPKREVKEIRPEELLGVVRVNGEGLPKPKEIVLSTTSASAGTAHSYQVQTAKSFGKDMVVPVGKYHVWVFPDKGEPMALEQNLEVKAGEVTLVD